jgi:hypothetical protein
VLSLEQTPCSLFDDESIFDDESTDAKYYGRYTDVSGQEKGRSYTAGYADIHPPETRRPVKLCIHIENYPRNSRTFAINRDPIRAI